MGYTGVAHRKLPTRWREEVESRLVIALILSGTYETQASPRVRKCLGFAVPCITTKRQPRSAPGWTRIVGDRDREPGDAPLIGYAALRIRMHALHVPDIGMSVKRETDAIRARSRT
jgi:hypothetical protein